MKHLLIDFESISLAKLDSINANNVCVWLFLGLRQQDHLSVDLCESLCRFGQNIRFVRVQSDAPYALSAYLSLQLGNIVSCDEQALISIVSKNHVYDALAAHIRQIFPQIEMVRVETLEQIPEAFFVANTSSAEALVETLHVAANRHAVSEQATLAVLEKYYPVIVQAMSQKDAYHPRHRRNLVANIERYLAQYGRETAVAGMETLSEQVIMRLEKDGFIQEEGDGMLSYHFPLV